MPFLQIVLVIIIKHAQKKAAQNIGCQERGKYRGLYVFICEHMNNLCIF